MILFGVLKTHFLEYQAKVLKRKVEAYLRKIFSQFEFTILLYIFGGKPGKSAKLF
jgi:hypothetical protein